MKREMFLRAAFPASAIVAHHKHSVVASASSGRFIDSSDTSIVLL